MVQNPGETLHTDAYKPVNMPEPVLVEEHASGLPVASSCRVARLYFREDRWRLDDEWWALNQYHAYITLSCLPVESGCYSIKILSMASGTSNPSKVFYELR